MARTRNNDLTAKQRDALLAYIVSGTTPGAARRLGGTERSTKAHLDVVRRKLGVEDVHGLLLASIGAGIIEVTVDGADIRSLAWSAS